MSDLSKALAISESIIFSINGEEKTFECKELSITEREELNSKLIGNAENTYIRKVNKFASTLAGKEKSDYLIGVTNSMPIFADQLGSLIFSNDGMRHLLKASIKSNISEKDINSILELESNGPSITKVLNIALKLNIDNKETISPN